MPVLKQTNTTPAMKEAIVLDLGDIGAQAARIRAAAETQAAKIISDAKQKAEQLADGLYSEAETLGREAGFEKGLAEGREQGRAEALAETAEQLKQLMAAWSQVATDWEQQRTDMEREARQAVLAFALSAAEKIVHRVIEVDESVVVDQTAQALSLVLSAHDASVRIHPVDRPILEDAMPQLVQELDRLKHIELIDDEEITPGGCVVAFGQGQVDATIERQLQRLINLILPEPPSTPLPEPEPAQPEPTVQQTTTPTVDLQGIADAAANEVVHPVIEPVAKPPVYEITDEGLVQTHDNSAEEAEQPGNALPGEAGDGDARDEPEAEV
ncbi:MAG: FliH/SctL family protein [Planctomycetota bacterium]